MSHFFNIIGLLCGGWARIIQITPPQPQSIWVKIANMMTHYPEILQSVVPTNMDIFLCDRNTTIKTDMWGFPGGAVVKNPPANAGDMGSSPDLGRSHMLQSN